MAGNSCGMSYLHVTFPQSAPLMVSFACSAFTSPPVKVCNLNGGCVHNDPTTMKGREKEEEKYTESLSSGLNMIITLGLIDWMFMHLVGS